MFLEVTMLSEVILLMEVHFTHPRNPYMYIADTSPKLAVREALEALSLPETGPFLSPLLEGRYYAIILSRIGILIPPNLMMGDAGVVAGEKLEAVCKGSLDPLRERLDKIMYRFLDALVKRSQTTLHSLLYTNSQTLKEPHHNATI
jgi:hypothetical protein